MYKKEWSNMKQRCLNKDNPDYESYGGRGIVICSEWIENYEEFAKDMGAKPKDSYSLDRINNDGNYNKNNCRWASISEQNINRRKQKNNTSGTKGVIWHKNRKKWYAQIQINNKRITIGQYTNLHDAVEARKQAEIKYHSEHMTP